MIGVDLSNRVLLRVCVTKIRSSCEKQDFELRIFPQVIMTSLGKYTPCLCDDANIEYIFIIR